MSAKALRRLNSVLGSILGLPFYRWRVGRKLRKKGHPPVLVWQMGKVGSSSIYSSVKQALPAAPLFHVHLLTDEMLKTGELYQKSLKQGSNAFEYNRCLREALLASISAGTRWKIISVVREPVARNLSAFFQNLELYFPSSEVHGHALDAMPVQTLIDTFLDKFDHERPMKWFDGEFKELLGLDVFAEEFPRERGHKAYAREGFDLLILRMEDMDKVGAKALGAFLALPGFELRSSNVGAQKVYARKYRKVKSEIVFPDDYLDRCYGAKYARHFYTDEELARFRQRWESKRW